MSLSSDYQYYNFIDENGKSISPKMMEDVNILDVLLMNNSNNIPVSTNDEGAIDNNSAVETSTYTDELSITESSMTKESL